MAVTPGRLLFISGAVCATVVLSACVERDAPPYWIAPPPTYVYPYPYPFEYEGRPYPFYIPAPERGREPGYRERRNGKHEYRDHQNERREYRLLEKRGDRRERERSRY